MEGPNSPSSSSSSANGTASMSSAFSLTKDQKAKRDRVERRMNRIKKEHRSSLKLADWQRYGYYHTFGGIRDGIVADIEALQSGKLKDTYRSGVIRKHCSELTHESFVKEFEEPYLPVVIKGIVDDWPAKKKWLIDELKDGEYREGRLKCGEDDDGYSCRVKLKTYLRYMRYNQDDSPLYVFESMFDEMKATKNMLNDYKVPHFFYEDLFSLVGEKRRPPYRWFLIGPERSGTGLHLDPLATSAWNTSIEGRKLWVLFKPGVDRRLVKGKDLKKKGEDDEAVTYFVKVLPRIRKAVKRLSEEEGKDFGMIEFIQYPGETVFIPGGWWHAVLNLDDTIAVTQNFASSTNFPSVWRKTRSGRKHMAKRWLGELEKDYPQLAKQGRKLNEEDDFEFVFSDKKKKKSDKECSEEGEAGRTINGESKSRKTAKRTEEDSPSQLRIDTLEINR